MPMFKTFAGEKKGKVKKSQSATGLRLLRKLLDTNGKNGRGGEI